MHRLWCSSKFNIERLAPSPNSTFCFLFTSSEGLYYSISTLLNWECTHVGEGIDLFLELDRNINYLYIGDFVLIKPQSIRATGRQSITGALTNYIFYFNVNISIIIILCIRSKMFLYIVHVVSLKCNLISMFCRRK